MDDGAGREPVEGGDDPVGPAARADGEAGGEADDAGRADDAADEAGRDPRRFNDWRKRSATGAVMTGIALGLKEALELPAQRPALVIEAPGEPDDPDRPIDLHFDPDDPAGTVAIVRHREDGDKGGAAGRS